MSGDSLDPLAMLEWYQTAGADEATAQDPVDRFAASEKKAEPVLPAVRPSPEPMLFSAAPLPPAPRPTVADAGTRALARGASTLEELKKIMENFDGCSLKASASHMVFGAGVENPEVMIVGEAPGTEEDRQGIPFVGVSGQLLDKMLASIGLDRTKVYISNILPWHPPANRKPSEEEVALFVPFIRRHIVLVRPKILLMLGGSAVSALTGVTQGITRARGKWTVYSDEEFSLPALASFHPAFLLRTPAQKKMAWRDFLMLKQKLSELNA